MIMKFRVWDKGNRVMLHDVFIDNAGFEYKYEKTVDVYENGVSTGRINHNVKLLYNIEVLQYIGIKDNNGEEIYDGDILLSSNEHGTFLQLIGFGDSDRDEDSMLIGFKIINGCTLENDDYEIDECKPLTQELVKKHNIPIIQPENVIKDGWWIIGNKYEDKDLLELIENNN